jgi:hypothetical protein
MLIVVAGVLFHRQVVVWHGAGVFDSRGTLEAVVRHAVELEDDYAVPRPLDVTR